MKNGKAWGLDNVPDEQLTADTTMAVNMLHDIFLSIWDTEGVHNDWKKGIIIKLQTKGDSTSCGNWLGIILLTTSSKVLGTIIIKRIGKEVDRLLLEEHAGFRTGRSTKEQIVTLRNIVEQAIDWNS